MANMSYCKFRNTMKSLRDCLDTIEHSNLRECKESLGSDEFEAMYTLFYFIDEILKTKAYKEYKEGEQWK